jgi:hypothetical protein
MHNSVTSTGYPPEIYGKIVFVWRGMSAQTSNIWLVYIHPETGHLVGSSFACSLPQATVDLFRFKTVTLHLLPNGIVTAISGIPPKETT